MLTGRGADVILIDDPMKPIDAMSESRRAAANDWFDSTLYSRLNDKGKGRIVIVMQRLHEDDLAGHVMRRGGWELVSFPAIAEDDERHVVETPFGGEFRRGCGEALDPAREPIEILQKIRQTIGEMNFAAQYQQRPARCRRGHDQGGLVSSAMRTVRRRFDRIIQSWDTANKASELADYSVCTTWGLKSAKFYLLNVLRKKLSYPDLKRAVIEEDARFSPEAILIEDRASGTQLIQELIAAGCSRATRCSPEGDKVMRLYAQSATIENGFVFLPHEAPWLADYLAELTTFRPARRPGRFHRPGPRLEQAPAGGAGHYRLLAAVGGGGVRRVPGRNWQCRSERCAPIAGSGRSARGLLCGKENHRGNRPRFTPATCPRIYNSVILRIDGNVSLIWERLWVRSASPFQAT